MKARRGGSRTLFAGCALLCLSILMAFGSWAMGSAATVVDRDVPYVPTPMDVVYRMLEMAEVGPGDIVYDLGCGDGRIVNTAAKEMGATGVGIDIDPQRIQESKANAQAAGVTDRVEFFQQDLFESEIGEATVVALYLLPRINLRLRPKLLSELEPGTRVVSHAFDMGEWQADQMDTVSGREIFYWIIPANMNGTWNWDGEDGTEYEMVVYQEFQRITGSVSNGMSTQPLVEPVLTGERVEFTIDRTVGGVTESVRYQGIVRGDSIEGRMVGDDDQGEEWKAARQPGSERPLEESAQERAGAPAGAADATI
jgi:SAM-dependent methyltransferase